jgi:hypothetical protein
MSAGCSCPAAGKHAELSLDAASTQRHAWSAHVGLLLGRQQLAVRNEPEGWIEIWLVSTAILILAMINAVGAPLPAIS